MSIKRARYKDVKQVGQSALVPFQPNESWQDRHARRKEENLRHESEFKQWCRENQWILKVANEVHHWMLKRKQQYIQWWPSSAKVVINEKWDQGIHCHDYEQLKQILFKHK